MRYVAVAYYGEGGERKYLQCFNYLKTQKLCKISLRACLLDSHSLTHTAEAPVSLFCDWDNESKHHFSLSHYGPFDLQQEPIAALSVECVINQMGVTELGRQGSESEQDIYVYIICYKCRVV